LGTATGLARGRVTGPSHPARRIEAVAFDGFAIFDPRPVGAAAEAVFPGKGADLVAAWRARQFEYTWLRTLTGSYLDFWRVTQDALAYACAALRLELPAEGRDRLMATYLHLDPWPDAMEVLRQLRAQGLRLAFLSNFTATMLDANIQAGGLDTLFEARLTTDQAAAYKPHPRSYQLAVDHFGLPRESIAFVAFAGWDAAGAKRFGFPVYWSNRLALPPEELDAPADRVAAGLAGLPRFLAER